MGRLSIDPANVAPMLVTTRATTQMRRVQSANPSTDRPSTQEREIGNHQIVGTTFDSPDVGVSVEAHLVNANILALLWNRNPATTFTDVSALDQFIQTDVDLMLVQRNVARTAWLNTIYFRQAGVASYRIAASVDGNATETIELQTNNKTGFERQVLTDHVIATSAAQTVFDLSDVPVALARGLAAGKFLISAAKSKPNEPQTYLLEGAGLDIVSVADNLGTWEVTLSAEAAADIEIGDLLFFSYQTDTAPVDDTYQSPDTTSPPAIRGYYHIPVTFTVGVTDLIVRGVQSIEATADFGIEQEVGMGSQAIGFFRQSPPNLSGNFVVFAENRDVEKFLIAGTTTSTDTDYPIEAYRDDIEIKLEFKHPETGVVLRTDNLINLTISGDSKDVAVGQAVGKQFNFVGAAGADWLVTKNV